MKIRFLRFLLICSAFLSSFCGANAQQEVCTHGLSYTMSADSTWGFHQPVITSIAPYSPAERAGLQANDIIEAIDDILTKGLSSKHIDSLLQDSSMPHILAVSNFAYKGKACLLEIDCKFDYQLSERELAEIFSEYSPDDALELNITYPFRFKQDTIRDLAGYHSFAFLSSELVNQSDSISSQVIDSIQATRQIDSVVNQELKALLEAKGLSHQQVNDADLLVSIYYELQPINENKGQDGLFSWRYDPSNKSLLPQSIVYNRDEANWVLVFGLVMQDKLSKKIVWSAEAKELLYKPMTVEAYASLNLPLILANFPFIQSKAQTSFAIDVLHYNYTGISLSANDISLIADVAFDSPAFSAGLRANDRILAVNGRTFFSNDLTKCLDHYLDKTKSLRKYLNRYIDVTGLSLKFFDQEQFVKVYEHIQKANWHSALSYLFAFRPYIVENSSQNIIFEVERNGQRYTVPVKAVLRDETNFHLNK